jgi:hypothetical protein
MVNLKLPKLPDWERLKSTSQKQLELELAPLEELLNEYVTNPPNPNKVLIAKNALSYVNKAKIELDKRRVQNAWALFYGAELLEYRLIDIQEIIDARAGKILFEHASLLDEGAKQNVRRLVGVASGNGDWKLNTPVKLDNLIEARRIVQDYYNDKYIYLGLTLELLSILTAIAGVLSLIITVTLTWIPSTSTISTTNWLFWFTIGLLGGSGGSISGLLGLQQAFALKSDTPERLLNKWITIAKPVLGFAAAIIIAIFVIAGLVQVANITISNYLIFAMAFISGFSERLIIGAVAARLPS